jgi:tetratricopeptide (TPR) repeat protein
VPSIVARLLFSAILIVGSSLKLSLESGSLDQQGAEQTHFYLTDPNTLVLRAADRLGAGPGQDLEAGRNILQGLLRTNAASAEFWSNLGAVYVQSAQLDEAKYCFLRAEQVAPRSVQTLLSVANYYINTHQVRSALPYLGRILSNTAQYDSTVFNDFDTLEVGFGELAANGGIPAQPRAAEAYFRHLLEIKDSINAREAWKWLKVYSPDDRAAENYIQFLLAGGDVNEASAVWVSQLGTREPRFGSTAFLLDGAFEREPRGDVFGWRINPSRHVQVNRDDRAGPSGGASLRLEFDGKENLVYEGVSQRVFLPRGNYRLDAFARTEGISTDEGVGLRVRDAQANRTLIETSRLTGTNDWKKLDGRLVVDAAVKLIEVQVVRRQSLRFDSLIGGTAWIAQVSLTLQR